MLEGLSDEEVDRYLEEHPKIVPLFEVDITTAVGPYITSSESDEPDQAAIREERQAHESLEKETMISQRVKVSQLDEVDLGTTDKPRPVNVAKVDKDQIIVMNLCGRGDKDIFTVGKILGMGL